MATMASRRAARRGSMGRSRRGRVASSDGASSVVGERGTMTEKRNLYLYLYLEGAFYALGKFGGCLY